MEKIKKSFLLVVFFLSVFGLCAQAATAQTLTPNVIVKNLYKMHDADLKAEKDRILDGKSRTFLDKYFAKTLADFIWKDLTTHSDEVGVLDFDPFYNAQDFEIKKLVVGQPKIVNGKANVIVTFENFDRKERLNYELVQQNANWKISDITYTDKTSLLGYFKKAAADANNTNE